MFQRAFFSKCTTRPIVFLDVLSNVCVSAFSRACTVPGTTCCKIYDASPRRGNTKAIQKNINPLEDYYIHSSFH